MHNKNTVICPCGSGLAFFACCEQYIVGEDAPNCEALMRSRYTAYVVGAYDYLCYTWHPDTCPKELGGTSLQWLALQIVDSKQGLVGDKQGEVSFIASFCEHGKGKHLHETSRFVRWQNRWVYVDGQCRVSSIASNDNCPCGSKRKFKRCCA